MIERRHALIVGASGALGGGIARELLARGFGAGLHYNTRREACDALLAQAQTLALPARAYQADFANADAPAALLAAYLKDFPRLDALVWAAGIVRDAPVLTFREDDLRAVLNVDLGALFLLLKSASRVFMKQKSGSVVALSSHAALAGRKGGAAYAMAHSGMLALVKSAAREWGALGVRVNAVLPPFVAESSMGRQASPEFMAGAKARRVLKSDADGVRSVALMTAALIDTPAISGQALAADSRIT
jgi:3-oxoacyl-[acyl-carrier protein] reductase